MTRIILAIQILHTTLYLTLFKNQVYYYMKPFTKTTTYTPIWIHENYSTFSKTWKSIRSTMDYQGFECFACDHKFEKNEPLAIISLKEVGNKVICQNCATKLKDS